MKRTVISLLMMGAVCLSGVSLIHAQTAVEQGLKSINRASAEAIVGFLADDELQGREAGMHGSRVAARYLAANLKEAVRSMATATSSLLKPAPRRGSRKGRAGRCTPTPSLV